MVQAGQFLERPAVIGTGEEDLVLEGLFHRGEEGRLAVVIAPPHPLMGGSMDSPVCNEIAYACYRAGYPSLRFNYRGVGASRGRPSGDAAVAARDFGFAAAFLLETCGSEGLVACGYSFGSLAAARYAGENPRARAVLLVAPPVARMDLEWVGERSPPGLVIGAERDAYGPPGRLREMFAGRDELRIEIVPGADHFFTRGLADLGRLVREWLARLG